MPKYVAIRALRVRSQYDEDRPLYSSISVIESDDQPVPTGLYDSAGVQLYRIKDNAPCGFTASAFVKKGD